MYRGGQWADLFGYYFYVDYCSGNMRSIKVNDTGGWTVNNNVGTFLTYSYSTFGEDRYGELYTAGLNNGVIYKIKGTICKPTSVITHNNMIPDTIYFCKGTTVILNTIFGDSLTYQWKLNGNNISGAVLNTYVTDSAGSYNVFVTNGSSCTNTSDAVILVDTCINNNYFVNENYFKSSIKIYPNPTTGKIVIDCNKFVSLIEIYNLIGDQINYSLKLGTKNFYEIDISNTSKGIYFIKIYEENGIYIKKIVLY